MVGISNLDSSHTTSAEKCLKVIENDNEIHYQQSYSLNLQVLEDKTDGKLTFFDLPWYIGNQKPL